MSVVVSSRSLSFEVMLATRRWDLLTRKRFRPRRRSALCSASSTIYTKLFSKRVMKRPM